MVLSALALAAAVLIHPGDCKQTRIGPSEWVSDGHGGLSASIDARTTGELTLRCRIAVPPGTDTITLALEKALVSFQPSGSKGTGSGLVIKAGACRIELVRVAGEDWIETPPRAWRVRNTARTVELAITLRDNSDRDPVRVDLTGLRLLPGAAENARVCEPVDHELDGDRGKNQSP
jgi:hypothetical protein